MKKGKQIKYDGDVAYSHTFIVKDEDGVWKFTALGSVLVGMEKLEDYSTGITVWVNPGS